MYTIGILWKSCQHRVHIKYSDSKSFHDFTRDLIILSDITTCTYPLTKSWQYINPEQGSIGIYTNIVIGDASSIVLLRIM